MTPERKAIYSLPMKIVEALDNVMVTNVLILLPLQMLYYT